MAGSLLVTGFAILVVAAVLYGDWAYPAGHAWQSNALTVGLVLTLLGLTAFQSCPGAGSVSPGATSYGRAHGITVIDGGCPLMFGPTADFGHKIMRLVYAGHVPKQV
jgi:hypothetical protein